ncbi:uncharacterized protein LOC125645579 [Ostrea edulis]|uniref:uncharacterized protein LOC125645579 n=1 Tax=Ostrea edulis TaxID=37623 RepID=UPI0024AFDE3B|nr:uncharacterized protein LOC125645579 [Ostrea edulis]
MATSDDEESMSNIDFSVISTSIDLGRPMLDQVVNGIHYGSPEVRNLLRNECDLIMECKICRNFFRSFPNFVAHKRVYCLEMNADKIYNDRLPTVTENSKSSETVVVEPTAPEESSPPATPQTTTVEKLVNGNFQGSSSAFRLYTDVAEKIERQRADVQNTIVTMTPISSNPNAVTVTVTQEKNKEMAAVVPSSNIATQEENKESCDCSLVQSNDSSVQSLLRNILERPLPLSQETQIKCQVSEEKTENSVSVEDKRRESTRKNETRKPMEDLRPVQSNLGSANRSFLGELSKKGLCHIKTLECLVCNKQMSSKKTLWNHMKFFHMGEKTVYPCLFCDKTFGRFYNISKHIMSCHNKSHKDIEKLKSKIKSMSYKTEDESGEESSPSSQRNTASERSKSGSQTDRGIKLNNCEGCGKAFWKKETYLYHRKQCKSLNPSGKFQESVADSRENNANQGNEKKQSEVLKSSRKNSSPRMSTNSEKFSSKTHLSNSTQKSETPQIKSPRLIHTRHSAATVKDTYMKTRFLDKRRAVQYDSPKKSSASSSSTDSSPKPSPKKTVSPRILNDSFDVSESPQKPAAESSRKRTKSGDGSDKTMSVETDSNLARRAQVGCNLISSFEKVETRSKSRGKDERESKAGWDVSNVHKPIPVKSQDTTALSENSIQTRLRKSKEDKSKDQSGKDKEKESSVDSISNKSVDQKTSPQKVPLQRESNVDPFPDKSVDQKTSKQKTPPTSSNSSKESSQERFIQTRKSKQLLESKNEQPSQKAGERVSTRGTQNETSKTLNAEKLTSASTENLQTEEDPQSPMIIQTDMKNFSAENSVKMRQKMQSPNKHIFAIQGKISKENIENKKEEESVSNSEELEEIAPDKEKEEFSRSRRKQVISVRQFDEVDGGKGTPVSKHNTRRSVTVARTPNTSTSGIDGKKENLTRKESPKLNQEKVSTEIVKQKEFKEVKEDSKEIERFDGNEEKRHRLRSKADWNSTLQKDNKVKSDEGKDAEKSQISKTMIQTRAKSAIAEGDEPENSSNIVYTAIQPKVQTKIWKSPNATVVKIQEIWVKKKPGQPAEEVKSSTITLRNTSTAQKRLSEKYRHPKRVYVMRHKKSTKPVCLDMNNIESLLDREKKQCKECGIQLKSMSNLRRHIVRHLGWKRYKCKLCPFSSFNRSECKSHLQRIHKERIAGKDVNNLIKDLKKEGTERRLQKKQQTLRTKQRLESEMAESNAYKETKLKASPIKNMSSNPPVKSIITTRQRSLIQSASNTKSSVVGQKSPEGSKKKEPATTGKMDETTSCPRIDVKAKKCVDCSITFANDYNLFRHVRNIHKFDTTQLKKSKEGVVSSVSSSSSSSKKSSKGPNTQDDTASVNSAGSEKSTRKRKRNDSGTSSDHKLKKTEGNMSAPTERKRSASLDGSYNTNDNTSVSDDLYDNLCSVSDNENDFNDRIGSPARSEEGGIMRLEPRVQTMFAALEEARATVRQRGKKLGIRRLSSPVKKFTPSPTDKKVSMRRSSARLSQDPKTPSSNETQEEENPSSEASARLSQDPKTPSSNETQEEENPSSEASARLSQDPKTPSSNETQEEENPSEASARLGQDPKTPSSTETQEEENPSSEASLKMEAESAEAADSSEDITEQKENKVGEDIERTVHGENSEATLTPAEVISSPTEVMSSSTEVISSSAEVMSSSTEVMSSLTKDQISLQKSSYNQISVGESEDIGQEQDKIDEENPRETEKLVIEQSVDSLAVGEKGKECSKDFTEESSDNVVQHSVHSLAVAEKEKDEFSKDSRADSSDNFVEEMMDDSNAENVKIMEKNDEDGVQPSELEEKETVSSDVKDEILDTEKMEIATETLMCKSSDVTSSGEESVMDQTS